jgi:very-short-patch-repair endonuclease
MKLTDVFPTNYAANAVACKLWGLLESPTEYILDLAIFNKLDRFYLNWRCWVYSEAEYRQALAEGKVSSGSFALVPQWPINQVGIVDLAIFIPGLDHLRPMVVVECDGHQFHERTIEQASKDRRRMRMLQRLGIALLPFTGTDVVRGSEEFAQEVVEFIDNLADEREMRWFKDRGIDLDEVFEKRLSLPAPYPWPRTPIALSSP